MRRAWVISTGTELALGQTVDTNTAWLAAQLAALGIRTLRHITVPDDADATRDVLLQAATACDVILLTGGLGPTDDDLTRQALADAAGVQLHLHPPSLDHLRAFFAARGREMPERNTVQALLPQAATALPNTCGTAPGICIALSGTPCYALPGVPFEMRAMFEREVAPALKRLADGAALLSRTLHTFGLGESDLGERIRDLMVRGRNPEVGTTAGFGLVGIRINAAAPSHADAEALLDQAESDLRRRLGSIIFGRDGDTLPGVVGALLAATGRTLSTAESCTGGLIGTLITDVAGSSRYNRGGAIAYANQAKVAILDVDPEEVEQCGAVSDVVARALALGAARKFGSDYAASTTGIAGPAGGTPEKPVGLVFIGLHTPTGTTAQKCLFGSDAPREAIRLRAARTALDLLRLELMHAVTHEVSGSGR
jgi:nicotinamide-nucleotide amidase